MYFATHLLDRILKLLIAPPPRIEVAYFPDPRDFFVPDTFDKPMDEPANTLGSAVADVGFRYNKENIGLYVGGSPRDRGIKRVGSPRLVVAFETS